MRARNIKPGFFKNEQLIECEPITRLLFIGLWCLADRAGRLEDRPRRIKAEIFPYEDCDIESMLQSLTSKGFIIRYSVDGIHYIAIPNFSKHQNPHIKEAQSILPEPPQIQEQCGFSDVPCEHGVSTVQEPCLHDISTVQASLIPDSLIPDSLIPDSLIPDSLIPDSPITPAPKKKRRAKHEEPDNDNDFIRFWEAYPRHEGKWEAYKCWLATLQQTKAPPDTLITAAANYAARCKKLGTEENFMKLPSTFLGPQKPCGDFIKADMPQHGPSMTDTEAVTNDEMIRFYAELEEGAKKGV